MFKLSRLAGRLLAAAALAAALLVPGMAYADEAVSFGGEDVTAGDQVYLGTWEGAPIAWDVEGASGDLAVHSTYILFNARIDIRRNPEMAPGLTLATSELYTYTLPNFKSSAFGGGESAIPGDFALSGDFGGTTRPDGSGEQYWINEPIYENPDTAHHDWFGWVVTPYGDRIADDVSIELGVRPASTFALTFVLFASAAEGGKSGDEGAGVFAALSAASSVSAWKFTLLDSSRAVTASASGTTAAAGYSSWTVPVTFSGGGTGSSDYVSAILCDSDGNAVYYGTVASGAASGTQDMAMPTGLAAGTYTLKVFSEQRNGSQKTDYAGPFVDIGLTVEDAPAEHTVKFVDEDGTEISTATYAEGTAATDIVKPADPTKPPTAQYTYEFAGWTPEVVSVTGDATYTATYSSAARKYAVTWKDDDGSVIDEALVEYGAVPTHADPAKAATAQYTYTFAGWTPEVVSVTGDATYTATYEATPVPKPAEKATLTFDLAGGTLDGKTGSITIEASVGDTIKLPAAPTREGYTFKYWKGSQYAAGAGYKVEGDHSFTAVWEKNATSDSGDSDKKSPLPSTGDDSAAALTLCALMALASLALLSGSVVLRRRGSAYKGEYSAR